MRGRILIVLIAGFLTLVPREAAILPEQAAVIPGWTWGTPFTSIRAQLKLVQAGVTGRTVRYLSNLSRIRSIPVQDCQLEFTDGRFSGLAFTTEGVEHSRRMLEALEGVYGGVRDRHLTGFQWLSGDTHVSYDEDSRGDAYVYLYAVSLQPGGAGGDTVRPGEIRRP